MGERILIDADPQELLCEAEHRGWALRRFEVGA